MNRKAVSEFLGDTKRIHGVTNHLKGLVAALEDKWSESIPQNERHPFAATIARVCSGARFLLVDFSDREVTVRPLVISRVIFDGEECVVVDETDTECTLPEIGVIPDYDTGEWGKIVPVVDEASHLLEAMRSLEDTYGDAACGAVQAIFQYMLERHTVAFFVSHADSSYDTPFHC